MVDRNYFRFTILVALALMALQSGCQKGSSVVLEDSQPTAASKELDSDRASGAAAGVSNADNEQPILAGAEIKRIVSNSPFTPEFAVQTVKEPKRLWAHSYIWNKAPTIEVEKWLSDEPDIAGKYVLLEIWTTWCSQFARSVKDLNILHDKYSDELVIVAISDEPEETVVNYKGPKLNYYSAIDTKSRVKNQLGVRGYPHVIIVEPGGHVVWEGFPYLAGYELTEDTIEKILEVGRKKKPPLADAAGE